MTARLSAAAAASLLGCGLPFIYWRIQQGAPWGVWKPPTHKGGRGQYYINAAQFAEVERIPLETVEAAERKRRAECGSRKQKAIQKAIRKRAAHEG